jgi:hypothetical protein
MLHYGMRICPILSLMVVWFLSTCPLLAGPIIPDTNLPPYAELGYYSNANIDVARAVTGFLSSVRGNADSRSFRAGTSASFNAFVSHQGRLGHSAFSQDRSAFSDSQCLFNNGSPGQSGNGRPGYGAPGGLSALAGIGNSPPTSSLLGIPEGNNGLGVSDGNDLPGVVPTESDPGGQPGDDDTPTTPGPIASDPTSNPEPATMTLICIGTAGMAVYRWRRRKTYRCP